MIKMEILKSIEDFKNLQIGEKIIIKYMNDKMFFLEITKIGDNQIIGKPDVNYLQETFIDIESLITRDLGKYIDCVIKLT